MAPEEEEDDDGDDGPGEEDDGGLVGAVRAEVSDRIAGAFDGCLTQVGFGLVIIGAIAGIFSRSAVWGWTLAGLGVATIMLSFWEGARRGDAADGERRERRTRRLRSKWLKSKQVAAPTCAWCFGAATHALDVCHDCGVKLPAGREAPDCRCGACASRPGRCGG